MWSRRLTATLALFLAIGPARASDFRAPDPDKIIAFAFAPLYPYSTGDFPVVVSKERFVQFLRNGEVISEKQRAEWLKKPVTFPDEMSDRARIQLETLARFESAREAFVCAGACASADHIWFWRLWNDHLLSIADESGQVWIALSEGPTEAPKLPPPESDQPLSLTDAQVREVQIAPPRNGTVDGQTKVLAKYVRDLVLSFFKERSVSPQGKDGAGQFELSGVVFTVDPTRDRGAVLLTDNRLLFWKLWNLGTLEVASPEGGKVFLILRQ